MKWAIAANMMGLSILILLIGLALRFGTRYRSFGSILIGYGAGMFFYSLIAPWVTN